MVTVCRCRMHSLVEGSRVLKCVPPSHAGILEQKPLEVGTRPVIGGASEDVWTQWSPDSESLGGCVGVLTEIILLEICQNLVICH